MLSISSPHKPAGHSRHMSTGLLPPHPPPKPIDLNSSTRSTDKDAGAKVTRRAFFCDVVVESRGEETDNLLSYIGHPIAPLSTLPAAHMPESSTLDRQSLSSTAEDDAESLPWTNREAEERSQRLMSLIEELVRTERSYLMRIRALRDKYAEPLRRYAKNPDHLLIPLYEAKTIFANIDQVVPASERFLADLEVMWSTGSGDGIVGDICLKHLKDLQTFEPYRSYLGKQDESQKMFQDCLKRFPSLETYMERIKYQTTGIGNIGLRELLMEPVQRIPRYTLLWRTMVKSLPPMSVQRIKLTECIEIASRIAKCEPDPQTVRATVMHCLERSVEGFPANLYSNNRDFIDSLDVEDLPAEYPSTSSPGSRLSHRPISSASHSTSASIPSLSSMGSVSSSSQLASPQRDNGMTALHCTLFLFDDKLMIVKRQSSAISGRKITGLDDVPKLVKTGGGVAVIDKNGSKKDKLSYRGAVDVLDIIATDVGNGDFHLFLERPPTDQSDRWSLRPFRSYTTVNPPFGIALDAVATRRDKIRFVQNLWAAQALSRTKAQAMSVVPKVLVSDREIGLENAGEVFGRAKLFWSIWDRATWKVQIRKAKVVVHIDEDAKALEIPLADEGAPFMVIRLHPMPGGLCRFTYVTNADEVNERIVIDMSDVSEYIATTIHRHGLFKFRTALNSCPTTPSSTSHRLRPSMLNLDTISRNLFGTQSVSSRSQYSTSSSDMFGTSSIMSKRKSGISRTSTMDTGRTSQSEDSKRESRSPSAPSTPEPAVEDHKLEGLPYQPSTMGQSEIDLNERLDVARKNSKSVNTLTPGRLGARDVMELRTKVEGQASVEMQVKKMAAKSVTELRSHIEGNGTTEQASTTLEQTIVDKYATPMSPIAPLHIRNKTQSPTWSSTTQTASPQLAKILPSVTSPRRQLTRASLDSAPTAQSEETLVTSPDPMGGNVSRVSSTLSTTPLSPRPQGPRSPITRAQVPLGLGSAHTRLRVVSGGGRRVSATRETVPLKGDENGSPVDNTPSAPIWAKRQHSEDQLTPRKRSPTRSPLELRPTDGHNLPETVKVSSAMKSGIRRTSGQRTPRRSSGPLTTPRTVSAASAHSQATGTTVDDMVTAEHGDLGSVVESSRAKIQEARSAVKRLRSEIHGLKRHMSKDISKGRPGAAHLDRQTSLPRSPQRRNIQRLVDYEPEPYSVSIRHSGKHDIDNVVLEECVRGIASMADRLDLQLKQALIEGDRVALLVQKSTSNGNTAEFEQLRSQVRRGKDTQVLLRQQLGEVQVEVDVIYEAFNTELDGMFEDAQLPATEAFQALRRDLQLTKAKRNDLALENMKLKRDLEESNLKREQWARILRAQGIIE